MQSSGKARERTLILFLILSALAALSALTPSLSQAATPRYYNMGNPIVQDIWVDPVNGINRNSGADRTHAVKTLEEAWNRIPTETTLTTTGYRIRLVAGQYPESSIPLFMQRKYGTFKYPVIIEAADGNLSAHLHGYFNMSDVRYVYLIGLDFITDPGYGGGGNVLHLEKGNHILVRKCRLNGNDGTVNQPQETIKANQCRYLYMEDSDISGGLLFSLDYVAVQYGHIQGCRIHDSGDDCLLIKGGTANLRIEANEIYNAGVMGFAAGQATGMEYMVPPWIHYEVYNIKFINNIVHDTQNVGVGLRGGYNVLIAYNTFYRVGINQESGAPLASFAFGTRMCDGHTETCQELHNLGAWGSLSEPMDCIPNRNVLVYNNIFMNPPKRFTLYEHFEVLAPRSMPADTNIPSPARADQGLRIRGNIIWNGPADFPLGVGGPDRGCRPSNPTCNETQIRADNAINTLKPGLANPVTGDFHPATGSNLFSATTFAIPSFVSTDRPQPPLPPVWQLENTVSMDKEAKKRTSTSPPGALILPH
ncbi:MAG: right-handed parallel beta-helix repeat-containing protein [Acidobacteriota bacterium]